MVEIVIFLLIVAAGLEMLSRRIGVPRPILLVIAGTLLVLVPAAPTVRVDPDLVFFIFLPPLLYWAAINTSWREFRRNGVDIMLLAIGLVVATAVVVAVVARSMFAMLSWPAAFALGAAVGPTDAVAATAVMRRFGVPRALVSILEGESLVNDATSLVIFEMAIAAGNRGKFSLGPALLSFLWAAGGGILAGLVVGWCIAALRRWIGRTSERSPVLESSISLLTPYVAFLAADRVGVSGVLAVVAAGLYLGHASARLLTAASRIQAINMWEIVDFLLEGLLFIFVGLGLPLALGAVRAAGEETLSRLIAAAAAVSAVVIVLRLAWVFPAAYAPRYFKRRFVHPEAPYPPWGNVFFVGWAGLRGAVSLVLALSVPFVTSSGVPFPGREVVIFVTFVVILVTLVGQGLTLRPLIWKLGLEPDRVDVFEESNARLQTAQAALARLDEIDGDDTDMRSGLGDADVRGVVNALRDEYIHRVHRYSNEVRTRSIPSPDPNGEPAVPDDEEVEADLDGRRAGSYRLVRLAALDAERQRLIQMRDGGDISDGVLHRVERDLDLEQSLLTGWGS